MNDQNRKRRKNTEISSQEMEELRNEVEQFRKKARTARTDVRTDVWAVLRACIVRQQKAKLM